MDNKNELPLPNILNSLNINSLDKLKQNGTSDHNEKLTDQLQKGLELNSKISTHVEKNSIMSKSNLSTANICENSNLFVIRNLNKKYQISK